MKDLESCRSALLQEAERLSAYCDIPVPAASICKVLGVRLRRTHLDSQGAFLVNVERDPEILLSDQVEQKEKLTKWERFLVAHELGHFILHRSTLPKPLGESEYWKHEHLCDAFARTLLLPLKHIHYLDRRFANEPAAKLNLILHLEKKAVVPWAAAAHRITELNSKIVFIGISRKKGRFRVNVTTLSNGQERGRLIRFDSKICRFFEELKPDWVPRHIEVELLDVFPSFRSVASRAAAIRTSSGDFRLAISSV